MSYFFQKTTEAAPDDNLKRLLAMRLLSIIGQVIALAVSASYLEMTLPVNEVSAVLILLVLWSLFSLLYIKSKASVDDSLFFWQLVVDVITLSAVLYFTGGATNPFAWFLLVPHSVASTLLTKRYVWTMAFLTSLAYTLLVFYYRPIMHLDHHMEMGQHFNDHVVGMWIGFVLSTILLAVFVAGMADTLRKRNQLLDQMKEQLFKDERIVALGTFATGAAHELGTPLGTMSVLAHELENDFKTNGDAENEKKMVLMQGQIQRCKSVLSSITKKATEPQFDSGQIMPVDEYIANVLTQWRVTHLSVQVKKKVMATSPAPNLLVDAAVTQLLGNVLDNAAEESPEHVKVILDWNEHFAEITIEDKGKGLTPELLDQLGRQIVSSKPDGMGVGLFVGKAAVERIGGQIQWVNQDVGVQVILKLPVS